MPRTIRSSYIYLQFEPDRNSITCLKFKLKHTTSIFKNRIKCQQNSFFEFITKANSFLSIMETLIENNKMVLLFPMKIRVCLPQDLQNCWMSRKRIPQWCLLHKAVLWAFLWPFLASAASEVSTWASLCPPRQSRARRGYPPARPRSPSWRHVLASLSSYIERGIEYPSRFWHPPVIFLSKNGRWEGLSHCDFTIFLVVILVLSQICRDEKTQKHKPMVHF